MSFIYPSDLDVPISRGSRHGSKINKGPTAKDLMRERIANIYRTGLTNNIWDNKQKSTSTHNTATNEPKSAISSNIYTNAQKPITTNNVSTIAPRSASSNNIWPNTQNALSTINTAPKYASTNNIWTTPQTDGKVDTQKLASIYRAKVQSAYNQRIIFTVHGDYFAIRRALWNRGWLEKSEQGWFPNISNLSDEELLKNARPGNDYERVYLNRLLYNYPSFFVWQPRYFRDLYHHAMPTRCYINRSFNLDFTDKNGLIGCAKHWFKLCGICGVNYPRFYRLKNPEERNEFIEDYHRTQCRNLIRYVIENISVPYKLADVSIGTISPSITLAYAVDYMVKGVNEWEYPALQPDKQNLASKLNDDEWKYFLYCSDNIVRGKSKFRATAETMREFALLAQEFMNIVDERYPNYRWDGVRNIWILKPANECRGYGIVVKNCLEDMLNFATRRFGSNYVVQKYIERPLLIYYTKFDIRQYMLITISKTEASIWLYKDCYLKFSSQVFTLDDLSQSIHLTNNSVQVHYPIDRFRDRRIPAYNMWSLEQFNNYLQWISAPADVWSKKIFAGIKENLIGVVLASFEATQFVPNTFELYGCDFMLDQNYNPILIEINHTPDMAHSTPVTERLCPMVLFDLIKVVVDLPINPSAPTGLFELAHRINYTQAQQQGLNVSIKDMTYKQQEASKLEKKLTKDIFYRKLFAKRSQLSKFLKHLKNPV